MSQNKTEVYDLPESELKKSKTWRENVDQCGMCTRCKEYTSILDYCCTGTTYFEGSTTSSEGLWEEIEAELAEISEPEPDAWLEDFYQYTLDQNKETKK
jgi:hypothetical protein